MTFWKSLRRAGIIIKCCIEDISKTRSRAEFYWVGGGWITDLVFVLITKLLIFDSSLKFHLGRLHISVDKSISRLSSLSADDCSW